ncbi:MULTISPECIES: flavin monoamine oxidase family protein [Rhodococcus]|uniref:flavin monoamine oxidase family protein n=1 Tax=Rhodococcus TaxID=1827 RepID=UPI0012288B2F|nr:MULTISPECIES: FAD-dependent oxidoreductase [Rhodococcus]QXW01293.1 FAD-dependent oxidoreductase [Rhodococcus globerulus]RZL24621.1 MAG: FAD-dependent oxidoreductase [Rhodococcus sp. (in: high G+C Gram-positive bacteria)]
MITSTTTETDVVVIGAGISGLTAARCLHNDGYRVVVLEQNDRVGGRTWSASTEGGPVDFGGMFIGSTHDRSLALGRSLGLTTVSAIKPGTDVLIVPSGRMDAPDGELPAGSPIRESLANAYRRLDALAEAVGAKAPWDHARAVELDDLTVADWLDQEVTCPDVRALLEVDLNCVLGAGTGDASLLYLAYYVAQCEGIRTLLATHGGAQNEWWIGGAGQISERIAVELGDAIHLSTRATSIKHDEGGATVSTQHGAFRARQVIIATPPAAASAISFSPRLPRQRAQLQMRAPLGRMSKIQVRYPSAFWEDHGYSGAITDTETLGIMIFPGTKPADSQATLIGFIAGRLLDRFAVLSEDERRSKILGLLEQCYGPQAASPTYFHETDWSQQDGALGGPATFMPTGVLSTVGTALRQQIGVLHFAGTEAASGWTGYMEGAVRAGETAATTVSAALAQLTQNA